MFTHYLGRQTNREGKLAFGDVSAADLAERFGTPLYVLEAADFRAKIRSFVASARANSPCRVAYASKANSALAVLAIALEEGLDVDVASLGELEAAIRAGFPPERIHLHGNNKSSEELARAVEIGIGAIVLDNFSEIRRLAEIANARKQTVMIRLAPGVDPETHQAIRTGQEDTKFGFNISNGDAESAVSEVLAQTNLDLRGYHCHVGSQLIDSHAHVVGARRVAQFAVHLQAQTGPIREINVGGGLGVRYTAKDSPETFDEHCSQIASEIMSVYQDAGLGVPTVGYEPGRSLIAEAGTTLYRVGVIKRVPIDSEGGMRAYLSVDGGLSDNPRPTMYDAEYSAMNADRLNQEHDTPFRIVGRHCESDVLISECPLPAMTAEGDLIAVQCTGAYNLSMSANYNRYPRPAMVIVGDGEPVVALDRETIEDLFRLERIPAKHA